MEYVHFELCALLASAPRRHPSIFFADDDLSFLSCFLLCSDNNPAWLRTYSYCIYEHPIFFFFFNRCSVILTCAVLCCFSRIIPRQRMYSKTCVVDYRDF